jgi:hypothetical protein
VHPYILYTIYKDRLAERERRAELNRIFLESRATQVRRPSRVVDAVRRLRRPERPERSKGAALRTDAYACR